MGFFCTNCSNDKAIKAKKVTVKYDASGLDYLSISGVDEYKCPKCGEVFRNYGNVEKLNGTIARYIATKKELLAGQEIRFIRKYLGFNTKMFAENILKVDSSTLSRYENDKTDHGETLDNFIKYLALTKSPDRDYEAHELLLKTHTTPAKILLKPNKGEWQVQALA